MSRRKFHRLQHAVRSAFRRPALLAAAAGAVVGLAGGRAPAAVITAVQAADYSQGTIPASLQRFNQPSAALGPINGDTGFGGLNPFNPPFATSDVVLIGPGGSLTLKLGATIPAATGKLGVFVNNGIIDVSSDGSGQAGSPAGFFSAAPKSIVSVSQDGQTFVPLGAGPVTFDNPTNAWLDSSISSFFQPVGTVPADEARPFTGHLSDFSGETYAQMLTTLNGSAGGTWLDLSSVPLSQVNYVRFDVPADANYRMALDSVSAVPEPAAGALLVLGAGLLATRRRSRA